ncbi:hypothetical protein [Nonomuraea fuscirosea]
MSAALDIAHTYLHQPPPYGRIRAYPAATDPPDLTSSAPKVADGV